MPDPTLFISAGEASGEAYGAMLISALQQAPRGSRPHSPRLSVWAASAWSTPASTASSALKTWRSWVSPRSSVTCPASTASSAASSNPFALAAPPLAILIDFPDIHFKLAEEFHRLGIPVLFFVSPQLWAWKKHRIKLVQRYVDRMLVIFPFEESFYRERGVHAEFVGHPLADLPLPAVSREYFAMNNYLRTDNTWIALLPGSRIKEISSNLPEMLTAARLLVQQSPNEQYDFPLPLASTLTPDDRRQVFRIIQEHGSGLDVRIVGDSSAEESADALGIVGRTAGAARAALFHSRAAIVASGTATVEAALIGNPFVVVYRVSPLTYAIAKRVVSVPHVAMANLIADKRVVPEFIQHDFTASNIVRELQRLLPDGPPRQSMMQELQRVRALLVRPGESRTAIDRVAAIALQMLGLASPVTESVPS